MKEAREAIQEVVDDDKVLAAVCLSDADDTDAPALTAGGRQTPRMRLAAALLGSYERQIQSVEGSLRVGHPVCLLHCCGVVCCHEGFFAVAELAMPGRSCLRVDLGFRVRNKVYGLYTRFISLPK